jgi:hypothetical protein
MLRSLVWETFTGEGDGMLKRIAAGALLVLSLGGLGCAYGDMAMMQDGTIIVTRNDYLLFGLLNKVYACKPNGAALTCTELSGNP